MLERVQTASKNDIAFVQLFFFFQHLAHNICYFSPWKIEREKENFRVLKLLLFFLNGESNIMICYRNWTSIMSGILLVIL